MMLIMVQLVLLVQEVQLKDNLVKAAVIGDPISHSLSPKLHGFWLKKYGINGSYEAIQVKTGTLESQVKSMVEAGFKGFNVTIPHKEKIFSLCNKKSQSALLTKAINTVIINENKELIGDNSDVFGFLENIKYSQPQFKLENKNAFVIGAGGAARAIVFGLITSKVKNIFITNRNQEKTNILINDFKNLAQENSCKFIFLNKDTFEQNLGECDLLINSTSLGMASQAALELNIANLKKSAIVYDIVYKPLMTDLLKNAQKQGNQIITGIGMLAFQAVVGFHYWFQKKPEVNNELIEYLLKQ